jgi:hypothetical protein
MRRFELRDEARFLEIVLAHSGYFTSRQFLGFVAARHPKRTTRFANKLLAKRHGKRFRLGATAFVYHLLSEKLYRAIGHDEPNRRQHGPAFVLRRLAILDFVLANPERSYLETERSKFAFFSRELGIKPGHLPSKIRPRTSGEPAIRYFTDGFPMFVRREQDSPPVVTFTFLQTEERNLVSFAHHLKTYSALFRELCEFRFLFVAQNEAHFLKARELFRTLIAVPLESNPADDLLRYFAIRKAWELEQYGALSEPDLLFRNAARERFAGERFDYYYRAWKAGRITESDIREILPGNRLPHTAHFEAQVLKGWLSREKESGGTAKPGAGKSTAEVLSFPARAASS